MPISSSEWDDKALRTARQAICQRRRQRFYGLLAGGLAAWRSGQYEIATVFSHPLQKNKNAPDVLRAGAGFWAYRGFMQAGDPLQAILYLNMATAYPETFYGVMAIKPLASLSSWILICRLLPMILWIG